MKSVLITGGAGFIGSHLADELLARGYQVRALDVLSEQVHGPERTRPEYLDDRVELVVGDIRDPEALREALGGVDAVFHFAAAVGVGQSMYEIAEYVDINSRGTAVLLEELIKKPVKKLVVASSMSVYGEGLYMASDGSVIANAARDLESIKAGRWEVMDGSGHAAAPVPTDETKEPSLSSVYALTKYDQEKMCLMVARAYNMPAVAMRFFNVYGPRQASSNPYTGVLAIFSARLMNGRPPLIYEDGLQKRDFVSVHDVAKACVLALETRAAEFMSFNVGSGQSYTISEIAGRLSEIFAVDINPEIVGKYRVGDIRHCFADIALAGRVLGYAPSVSLDQGLLELRGWLEGRAHHDRVAEASAELDGRGLTI